MNTFAKEYILTNQLEMLETVRRAIQHGVTEIKIVDCSGDAVGYWVYMDLACIVSKQEEMYITEFVANH